MSEERKPRTPRQQRNNRRKKRVHKEPPSLAQRNIERLKKQKEDDAKLLFKYGNCDTGTATMASGGTMDEHTKAALLNICQRPDS